MHLTDIVIRNLQPPAAGQKTYFDDTLPSFGCRVSQGGTKTFVLRHSVNRQQITLGRYPIISLADARQLARERLAEIVLGKHRAKSIPWDDAMRDYLADCELKNRPSTVNGYRKVFAKHFRFGRRKLSEITYEEMNRRLKQMLDRPGARNHALTATRALFNWAKKPPRRYIDHNPCEGMTPSPRPSRKRTLTDDELVRIYRTALEGTDTYSQIVATLMLTGQRRGETTALRWSWIDTQARTITIPESVAKNKCEHTFPYGEQLAALLARNKNDSEFVFPASREHVRGIPTTHYNGWTKDKDAFVERCGVEDWTLHDLRRSFATHLARMGVQPHVIERLLNHRMGAISNKTDNVLSAVAEIYNRHTYLPEMRAAIGLWESKLDRICGLGRHMAAAPHKRAATASNVVVPFRPRHTRMPVRQS